MKKNMLHYKGFLGSIEFDLEEKILFGKVLGISDLVSYEGRSIKDLEGDFKNGVCIKGIGIVSDKNSRILFCLKYFFGRKSIVYSNFQSFRPTARIPQSINGTDTKTMRPILQVQLYGCCRITSHLAANLHFITRDTRQMLNRGPRQIERAGNSITV